MERKLLLVFALTFLVIMLFQPLLKKYGPQPPATKPESSQQIPAQSQPDASAATAVTAEKEPVSAPSSASSASSGSRAQATSESDSVIENNVFRIVFTNRGGKVKSWVLKKFTDDKGGQLELVNDAASKK